ncbi:exodeoxyribonuclease VII large subunit [Eubacterium sp. MSJ-13]|uniref:exodeoxyribonuclease VII large subunit n=1 Tax=Eubacterium sp. MSJ-13 TaxID=2841513 RepID=UPI001C120C15|nr:exodeoxyribonuclease VII large subunit [Eubacterium sp. MSJ-13]MBU5479239.1 exodeoxyribonuclease VII large subunit [Eubacterium sp. MSJ-13]
MGQISSVSQINMYIKNMFLRDYMLSDISVKGEVSNCKYHSSGHIYFTIKDRTSQLSCVMFASMRKNLEFKLEEGQSIVVRGNINVYERDGKYQLYARDITKEGAGRLYEEYERLKKRLLEEGLFDESKKKKIPAYAKKIGVVTAKTGAVIQDICNVSHRRNPYVQIILYPAKVQGTKAADTIIKGIRYFENTDVDTIIIGRGGGSIEDLWEFNDERLARVIAGCKKPIISAVGHETDTTIADYVADLRAPTPSAAAELAVYSYRETVIALREAGHSLRWQMENILKLKKMKLAQYITVLQHESPRNLINERRMYVADMQEKIESLMQQKITSSKHQLELYIQEMKGLSPLYKLQGGYAYVSDESGKNIKSVDELEKGKNINLAFKDGYAKAVISSTEKI